MGWWTPNNKLYAYSFLVNAGLSPYGAAGLVSRWANVESTAAGPTSQGGYKGRAWGIAQWLGPRLPAVDGDPDFDDQLNYVVQELNGSEARAASLLRSASDVASGARAATAYERAGGWNAATNTDNYTSKTAAGMPEILALAGNQPQINTDGTDQTTTQQGDLLNLGALVSGGDNMALIAVGVGVALLLILTLSD